MYYWKCIFKLTPPLFNKSQIRIHTLMIALSKTVLCRLSSSLYTIQGPRTWCTVIFLRHFFNINMYSWIAIICSNIVFKNKKSYTLQITSFGSWQKLLKPNYNIFQILYLHGFNNIVCTKNWLLRKCRY